MLKQSKNQKTQLTPKCANLQLSSYEVTQLKNLLFNAIWYNDECNNGTSNPVLGRLMDARGSEDDEQVLHAVQFLSKVGHLDAMITKLHDQLTMLENTCKDQ